MSELQTKVDRVLDEHNARLAEINLKLAEHNCRLADCEKSNKWTSDLGNTKATELLIFSFGFLFGLGFTLADSVVDSLYYGSGE